MNNTKQVKKVTKVTTSGKMVKSNKINTTKKSTPKSTIKSTKQNKQKKYKTSNGIQELPNGSFRIRKQINGVKYDGCFTSKHDAIRYLNLLVKELSNTKM